MTKLTAAEKLQVERRSEFSRLMRKAQQAKKDGDWFLVKYMQLQMTNCVEHIKLSQEV